MTRCWTQASRITPSGLRLFINRLILLHSTPLPPGCSRSISSDPVDNQRIITHPATLLHGRRHGCRSRHGLLLTFWQVFIGLGVLCLLQFLKRGSMNIAFEVFLKNPELSGKLTFEENILLGELLNMVRTKLGPLAD